MMCPRSSDVFPLQRKLKHVSPFFIFFMLYQHKCLPVRTHILLFDSIWYVSRVSSCKVYQESRVLDFVDPSPHSDSEAIGCCLKLMMLHSVESTMWPAACWSSLKHPMRSRWSSRNPISAQPQIGRNPKVVSHSWADLHKFHWFAFSQCFLVCLHETNILKSINLFCRRPVDMRIWWDSGAENTIGWRMAETKVASSRQISIGSGYLQLFWKLRRSIKKNPWLLLPFTSIGQLQVSVVFVHFSWINPSFTMSALLLRRRKTDEAMEAVSGDGAIWSLINLT